MTQWTREWWEQRRNEYQLVTSVAVIEELREGKHPFQAEKLAMMASLPLLDVTQHMRDVVKTYIARKAMPDDPRGDALHLAIASVSKCDILLSWNCKHIVNPRKAAHIEALNKEMRLFVPRLATPLELLKMEGNYET